MTKSDSPISIEDYGFLLRELCSKDTSLDPNNWTENNYLHGHCAVVSLQAQKLFGGTLLRASLDGTPYSYMGSHYKNKIDDKIIDFTGDQFTEGYPNVEFLEVPRTRPLSSKYMNTVSRYVNLTLKLTDIVSGQENPLFNDEMYKKCISQAVLSPCPKAGFGAIIKYDGIIASEDYNHNVIPEIASQCEPKCIRLDIQSRTESMLGSCSHAEELAMNNARKLGIPLNKSDIYIAGIKADGFPWIKEDKNHSCIRCAQQMYLAELQNIYVPVKDRWERLSTNEAVITAQAFALKDRKI